MTVPPSQLGGLPDAEAVPEVEGGEGGHADFGGFEDDPDKVPFSAVCGFKQY